MQHGAHKADVQRPERVVQIHLKGGSALGDNWRDVRHMQVADDAAKRRSKILKCSVLYKVSRFYWNRNI